MGGKTEMVKINNFAKGCKKPLAEKVTADLKRLPKPKFKKAARKPKIKPFK